jgi:hypothetical protein
VKNLLNLVKRREEKATQTIQNFDYFTPLRQLGVELSKDKISEYGTKIKEIYYGKMNPTLTNVESYYHVRVFLIPLQKFNFINFVIYFLVSF